MELKESWPDTIRPDLFKYFTDEYGQIEKMVPFLYSIQTSNLYQELMSSAGEYPDLTEFDGTVTYADMYEGYLKTFTHTEYSGGLQIRNTLVDDAKGAGQNIFGDRPQAMARAVSRTREKHGVTPFADAFTAENTSDTDGTELCADDHPRPKDSTTQNNEGTTTFSPAAVEATRLLMRKFKDDQGDFCDCHPDTLLIPEDLHEEAWEIIESDGKINTATNNKNFHKGRYNLAEWLRLSDANNWFMVDSKLMKRGLYWFNRTPIQFFKDNSSDTMSAKYIAYFRRSLGYRNWRWIYGHAVT